MLLRAGSGGTDDRAADVRTYILVQSTIILSFKMYQARRLVFFSAGPHFLPAFFDENDEQKTEFHIGKQSASPAEDV